MKDEASGENDQPRFPEPEPGHYSMDPSTQRVMWVADVLIYGGPAVILIILALKLMSQ